MYVIVRVERGLGGGGGLLRSTCTISSFAINRAALTRRPVIVYRLGGGGAECYFTEVIPPNNI